MRTTPETGSAYVSGGRNPNWQLCCGTCKHLIEDQQYPTHGWCPIHNNASVSITGGCETHSRSPNTVYAHEMQYKKGGWK